MRFRSGWGAGAAAAVLAVGVAAPGRADLADCYAEPTHACVVDAMAQRYARLDAEFAASDAEMGIEPQYPPGWFAAIAALEGYVRPLGPAGAVERGAWIEGAVTTVIAPFFTSYADEPEHFDAIRNLVMNRLHRHDELAVEALLGFFEREVEAGGMASARGTPQFPDEAWQELVLLRLYGYADVAGAQAAVDRMVDANASVPLQQEIDAIRQAAEAGAALNPGMPDFNTWYAPGSLAPMLAQLEQVPPGSEDWVRWAVMTALVQAQAGEGDEAARLLRQAAEVAADLTGDTGNPFYSAWEDSVNRQELLNIVARAQAAAPAPDDALATVRLVLDQLNALLAEADRMAPSPEPERGTAAEQRQRIVAQRRDMTTPMEDLAETLRVIEDRARRR
jgi:hypothetical protein